MIAYLFLLFSGPRDRGSYAERERAKACDPCHSLWFAKIRHGTMTDTAAAESAGAAKRIQALHDARRRDSESKRNHVRKTLESMVLARDTVTFASVARRARVSTWLVYADGVREHIQAETKAVATGDPRYLRQVELEDDVKRLTALERAHQESVRRRDWRVTTHERSLPAKQQALDRLKLIAEQAASHTESGAPSPITHHRRQHHPHRSQHSRGCARRRLPPRVHRRKRPRRGTIHPNRRLHQRRRHPRRARPHPRHAPAAPRRALTDH